MRKRFLSVTGGMVLSLVWVVPSTAADNKIEAFMMQNGKVVFTNAVENTPARIPVAAGSSLTASAAGIANPIHKLIESIAGIHGLDPALVKAIVKTESNFNRFAVSSKGARGLMQLIPATGARFGVEDFFDPTQNIEGGVRYMKFLLEKFKGNLDLSLAAYNAGENLVARLGRIPSIPETQNYVRKVRANYGKPSADTIFVAGARQIATPQEAAQIYRTVDERGVVHFSNAPPN